MSRPDKCALRRRIRPRANEFSNYNEQSERTTAATAATAAAAASDGYRGIIPRRGTDPDSFIPHF